LEAIRQAQAESGSAPTAYFASPPVLRVATRPDPGAAFTELPVEQILVADLSLWQRPPETKDYTASDSGAVVTLPIAVAVDPVLGRMTFPAGQEPDAVEVGCAHGFSGDLGGGPYDRGGFVDPEFARRVTWQRGVGRDEPAVQGEIAATLAEAIDDWNAAPAGTVGVIAVLDNRTYEEALPQIALPPGSELLVVAADWPGDPRVAGRWVPTGCRAHVIGEVSVAGAEAGEDEHAGRLTLEGLLIEGTVRALPGDLGGLRLADCTIVPDGVTLAVESSGAPGGDNAALEVELERTISGGVELAGGVPELTVSTCIVQAGDALVAPDAAARIDASTILGSTGVRSLHADNSIFDGVVTAARRQIGCVRFSFVARDPATSTPRRYRCQPDLALAGVEDPEARAVIEGRVVPVFSSTEYGDPGYAQLGGRSPAELAKGAEDGSEQGAFMFLRGPQRRANLRAALDEYLRLGLEAGVFPIT
ncbi:MAG: hypothetical protein ACRDSN_03045, partial [Pseudonocardiaceae bacterium]